LENHKSQLTRVLGFSDLSFFLIAALVNLNSVPVVAGAGSVALVLWIAGFAFFFIPQGIAVLELSSRYPEEGGIYRWTKIAFGDFHGFMSGWCYWTNNIFYIPTLLFYIVGFAAFIGGKTTAGLADNPAVMVTVSLFLLWAITALNIRGLGVSKWVQNLGALGTFATTMIIFGIGFVALSSGGMATPVTSSVFTELFSNWQTAGLLSVVCLNYVGLELGSVIGDEIKDPRRNIPRAALFAGISTVVLYLLSTFSLQATVPSGEIGVIDGILQAAERAAKQINMAWIVAPIAILMTFNAAGNTSAWLTGAARIPFVIGIDRYLPSALGRLHGRYNTPHVALIVQGVASSLFIIITSVGSSVRDTYMVLLQTTVVLQLIPYVYMFAALIRVRRRDRESQPQMAYFRMGAVNYAAGAIGLLVSAGALLFAFLPTRAVEDVWNFELKLVLGTLSFLVPAVAIYLLSARRIRSSAGAGPMEIAPE
jgi:glutamate:GABA antiporter